MNSVMPETSEMRTSVATGNSKVLPIWRLGQSRTGRSKSQGGDNQVG